MPSTKRQLLPLDTPLSQLPRIGPAYLARLSKNLKLKTISDLIYHFPHRYEDFTDIKQIADLEPGTTVTIQGTVLETRTTRTWKRKLFLTEADIEDESGSIMALWYNQPYLAQTLKQGTKINLSGKIVKEGKKVYLQNPVHEVIHDENQFLAHTGRLVPVYPETRGVSSRWIRYQIKQLISTIEAIPEFLPPSILSRHSFLPLHQALKEIHFPTSYDAIEKAKQRLSFDEIFFIQLFLALRKETLQQETAPPIAFDQTLIKNFVDSLPFKLTNAQRKAAWEIFQDIQKPHPMNRLLNGDVGTGKTLVAILATLQTASQGHQSAFMAPTEILAWQHFNTFTSFLKHTPYSIALISAAHTTLYDGKTKTIKNMAKKDAGMLMQKTPIIIGTHSLIQNKKQFSNLALAIIDEQHRFGVAQRAKLVSGHNITPHLLSMTATPIPRTLSLAIYGDLDISILNEIPRGERTITTKIVLPHHAPHIHQFVLQKMQRGEQVFVICPRIEEKEETNKETYEKLQLQRLEMKAVETEYEKLKKIFPNASIVKLHGRMKPQEKTDVLENMRQGKIDILVATSVVEVGIDIPNASILWVENAERFGLAQLHQFRGRIGRKGQEAWCFLFSHNETSDRLKAMTQTNDGFKLAQKDLQIRGPGEFYGVSQWGFPNLTIGSLADYATVKRARDEALTLLKEDASLHHYPALKDKFSHFTQKIHLE